MNSNSIVSALKFISQYLNDNNIPYVVVGGISVIAWGRSRTTDDINIIVDQTKLNIENFVSFLKEKNFLADMDDFLGFQSKDHCTIFFKEGLFRIDIIGIYNQDNKISINQSVPIEFYGIRINIDSPESLITHKLQFGSDQDLEDAFAILIRLNNKLNKELLLWHAERLNVVKKLKELMKKAES